jgi:hypothetical protein
LIPANEYYEQLPKKHLKMPFHRHQRVAEAQYTGFQILSMKLLMTHADVFNDPSRQHSVKVIFIRHHHCVCLIGISCDGGYVDAVGVAEGVPANCPAQGSNLDSIQCLQGTFMQTAKWACL